MRTSIRIRNEYKDYTALPAVLLAQQAPIGPARPKMLAITSGGNPHRNSVQHKSLIIQMQRHPVLVTTKLSLLPPILSMLLL
jgi:hypothetical protein